MPVNDVKRQIQEEVARILMSSDKDDKDDEDIEGDDLRTWNDNTHDWNEPEDDEEEEDIYGPEGNPWDNESVLIWDDGDGSNGSIELIPQNMESMKKYYFEWNGNKMYVQKKSIGTDKFEIGIFLDEEE